MNVRKVPQIRGNAHALVALVARADVPSHTVSHTRSQIDIHTTSPPLQGHILFTMRLYSIYTLYRRSKLSISRQRNFQNWVASYSCVCSHRK